MPDTVAGDSVGTCFLSELDGSQLILPIYLPGFPEEQVTMFTTKDPEGQGNMNSLSRLSEHINDSNF